MENHKAQSAVEFASLVTLMFLIFTVFFFAVSTKLTNIQEDNDRLLLEDLGSYVQNELRLANIAEDGYYRTFEVPRTLLGKDYEINITKYEDINHTDLVVRYINHSIDYEYVVPIGNLTGKIDKNKNTTVKIVKQNNIIIVST